MILYNMISTVIINVSPIYGDGWKRLINESSEGMAAEILSVAVQHIRCTSRQLQQDGDVVSDAW